MNGLFSVIIIIFIIILFNKIYFFFNKEKVIFLNYFKNFIIYSIIIFITIYLLEYKLIIRIEKDFFQVNLITYIFIFFVMFFNISTKSYESPTVIIYDIIKNKSISYNFILQKLKKKKLINVRIKDLFKQKLIYQKKNYITLTPSGKKFCRFYKLLKNFYKVKSKG
tara:strand:+ start:654 stop:1151 length:498 start_codon:yes stop_codon:yes gene_type:complete